VHCRVFCARIYLDLCISNSIMILSSDSFASFLMTVWPVRAMYLHMAFEIEYSHQSTSGTKRDLMISYNRTNTLREPGGNRMDLKPTGHASSLAHNCPTRVHYGPRSRILGTPHRLLIHFWVGRVGAVMGFAQSVGLDPALAASRVVTSLLMLVFLRFPCHIVHRPLVQGPL